MNGLKDIVARNKEAVRQGVVKPGDAVGTTATKPVLYDVIHNGELIKQGVTIAECSDIRDIQGECEFIRLTPSQVG